MKKDTTLQDGHDAPVKAQSEDCYDRWPIATTISRIIATAPPEWSTRIGLFGPWGDGKTSVLNFLEHQQRAAGNIVIRYAPWGASTPDEVWKDFGTVLIEGLKKHGISSSIWKRGLYRLKATGAKRINTGVLAAGNLAEATGYPGAAIGANLASSIIEGKLKFTRQDIERLTEQLGRKRVVVFIDDLDRTEGSVVPKLLLVLRELLDFAKFAFVLAFDRKIVAASLADQNRGWGNSGESFLNKVIDFPIELPRPRPDQVRRLAFEQFGRLCPFVPDSAVESVAKLFPENPRKLKLLARMISSMGEEVARHEATELQWDVILLLALVRAESEPFAARLLAVTVEDDQFSWAKWFSKEADEAAQKKAELESLMAEFPELGERQKRIEDLVGAWREKIPSLPGERLRYQAMFALSPHCITWGEFKEFFAVWRDSKHANQIEQFVVERMYASEERRSTVENELSETILGHYSTLLESASWIKPQAAHFELIREAADSLELLMQSLIGEPPICRLAADVLALRWQRLHGISLQWCQFRTNPGEPELREKELQTLLTLGKALEDPLGIYGRVKEANADDVPFGQREADLRKEMAERLLVEFEPAARAAALCFVISPGSVKKLRSGQEHQDARFLLTAQKSPLFGPHKQDLMNAISSRTHTTQVVEDFGDYLNILLSALEHGDSAYCSAEERIVFIQQHADFVGLIWSLCVSQPSQFRMLQSLRKRRDKLLGAGMPVTLLSEPEWLQTTTA